MTLKLNPTTHILDVIPYSPSPNHNERPANTPINMIVIHGISLPPGHFGGDTIEQFFCNTLDMSSHPDFLPIAHLRVSAHLLIKRNGDMIQFVPFNKRAWHAGVSQFQGKTECNDFSIGIELEGTDETPYELAQYITLGTIVSVLLQTYPEIKRERIVGHSDIAPGRKTDPGPYFDWNYFRTLI